MIKLNVQAYCLRAGITYTGPEGATPINTSYKLFHACKFKSPTMASQIWKGDMVKIGLATIEALCRGLRCTASELFLIVPDPVEAKPGVPARPAVKAPARSVKPAKKKATPKEKADIQARVLKNYRGALPAEPKSKGGKKTGKKRSR